LKSFPHYFIVINPASLKYDVVEEESVVKALGEGSAGFIGHHVLFV
jgi:hypothetical protein